MEVANEISQRSQVTVCPWSAPRGASASYRFQDVMLCSKLASRKDGICFPCGQCLNCRINKRRNWQARLLLEAASHGYNAFVTVTFRDVGTPQFLRRSDVRFFVRNLRKSNPDVRYFAAGEYGTKKGRAHYHFNLFSKRPLLDHLIREAWPFGSVHIGDCEPASLDYALGYLLKGRKSVPWPIEIRYPEFRSFSKGIGQFAFDSITVAGLLPREFRVFGRTWPIGRYFRLKAERAGVALDETKQVKLEKYEAETMRAVLNNPKLSQEEITQLYDSFLESRKKKLEVLKKKAIRDAYKERHGISLLRKPDETF